MGFFDALGDVADTFGDAGEQSLGVVKDLADVAYAQAKGESPWKASREFNASFARRAGEFTQEHKTLAASAKVVFQIANGGLQTLGLPHHYLSRGTSTALQYTGLFNFDHDRKTPSLSQAWKNSERTSVGQALWINLGLAPEGATFKNVSRYGDRGDAKFDSAFSWQTGSFDAAWVFTDPLIAGGKAVKAIKTARESIKAADLGVAAGRVEATTRRAKRVEKDFDNILDATEGKSAYEINVMLRKKGVNNAAGLSAVLGAAKNERETRRLVMLASMGDQPSFDALTAQRKDIADQIVRLNRDLDEDLVPAPFSTPDRQGFFDQERLNTPERIEELKAQRDDLEQTFDQFDRTLGDQAKLGTASDDRGLVTPDEVGLFGSVQKRVKFSRHDLRMAEGASAYTVSPGIGGIPVRVLRAPRNKRPGGWMDFHDADSSVNELEALTRRTPGLLPEQRTSMLERYINAPDDNARRNVVIGIENEIFDHLGALHGYDVEDVRALVTKFMSERQAAVLHYKQQNYGFLSDGSAVHDALLEAHLANGVPTMPVDLVNKVLKRNAGRYRALKNVSGKSFDYLDQMADVVNDIWRFEALFRGGYIIRNAVDSQLRMLAFLGAHQQAMIQVENAKAAARRAKIVHDTGAVKAGLAAGDKQFAQGVREVGPYRLGDAFGATRDEANAYMTSISSAESIAKFVSDSYTDSLNRLRGSGNWVTKSYAADNGWDEDYLRVVNQHFRQSAITQRLMRGDRPEAVVAWLKSPEGRRLRRRMVYGADTPEALVQRNLENLNHALPVEAWREFAERPMVLDDIARVFPEGVKRPKINAEQMAHSQGEDTYAEMLMRVRDGYFNIVSKATDDAIGRHPLFVALYRGQVMELMKRSDDGLKGVLTGAQQRALEEQARIWARREMKNIMFDVSQKSDLAHFMRFLMPFYAAWQDAITKYGRLLMRDPSRIAYFAQAWTAPNDASFVEVVNANGEPVPSEKSHLSDDEYVRIPATWAKKLGLPWTASISKASFNIALQGDPIWAPGWGPMGQAPANELVKRFDSPELAKVFEEFGVLPFGASNQSWKGYFLAGALRQEAMPEGRKARLISMVIQTEYFKAQQEGHKPPTEKEIRSKVNALLNLRRLTSALSPLAVQYSSPYQFYIDQSHAYDRQVGPGKRFKDFAEADKAFLEDFGEDYYIFRMSQSKTNVPIAASARADKAARKVSDLVNKFPKYTPLFIGPNNTGEYDRNVYTLQEARQLGMSRETWRSTYADPMEALRLNRVEQGWIEYQKLSDRLEAIRVQRGLSSLQSKGAEDLAQIKRDWVTAVAGEGGPEWGRDWYREYNNFGSSAIVDFLDAASAAVDDPRINQRKDIQTLAKYMRARQKMRDALLARQRAGGSGSITAQANSDLAGIWLDYVGSLTEGDLVFGNVYQRYLERDDLSKVAK